MGSKEGAICKICKSLSPREGNITQTQFLSPVQDFPYESAAAAAAAVKQADLQTNTIAYICTMYITVERLMTHY